MDERFDPAVRIVEPDPGWPLEAGRELGRLEEALGTVAVRLEHVGSTAVPGLASKPAPESPDYHFFAKPPKRPRSHHLHVCEAGSEHEFPHVALRDFLRAHSDEAAGYAALKRDLAARHPQDRLAYISGKEEYLTRLEARAVRWARGLP